MFKKSSGIAKIITVKVMMVLLTVKHTESRCGINKQHIVPKTRISHKQVRVFLPYK